MAYEEQRAERDFRMNPPEDAPGQGDNGWGDTFDSMPVGSSSAEPTQTSQQNPNDPNMLNQMNGMQQQNPQMKPAVEDRIMDGVVVAGKGVFKYLKFLIASLKNNTQGDWHRLGVRITKISVGGVILGLFFCVIELFTRNGNKPINLMIGSLLSMAVGVFLCMNYDKDDNTQENQTEDINQTEDWSNVNFDDSDLGIEFDDDDTQDDDTEDFSFGDDDEGFDFSFDEDEFDVSSNIESEDFDLNAQLDSMPEIQMGTQTRQYLYETFMKVLPTMNPGFAEMNNIDVDSDSFYEFEDLLRSAAYQVGTKEESIPELESLYENDFIYRLNCTRPVGLKEQAIADEIASAFSRDDNNRVIRFGCYATVETSVGKYTINIFKGSVKDSMGRPKGEAMISLGDIYRQIRDFMCSPDVEIPFVWGVNELGDVYYCDMKDNNSIIISGEPRGGKSWKGQSIVAQLSMFHSPKELEFYFFDGKDEASDYRYLSTVLPHAKYFCGNMDKINDGLEQVINMMVEERGKKITDSGCINIKDYNRKYPNDKLPYVYVVIDELQSLMGHFVESNQKEESARFKSYLSTMVSKLPYTGLRFILFPHRIVNDIISKNTYSLVSCRAVVRQTNFDEVKNAMNVTEKSFPYKLAQVGDIALKINEISGGNVVYCHSEVLTSNNEGNKRLYDYIGGVWKKLEPECGCITIEGSIGGYIGTKAKEILERKTNKPARDNSEGIKSYEYHGFENGSSISDMSEDELNGDPNGLDTDSEFWDVFNQ